MWLPQELHEVETNTIQSSTGELKATCIEVQPAISFDIGTLTHQEPTSEDVEMIVQTGSKPYPSKFLQDVKGSPFPISILRCKEKNGDITKRDWLIWSESKEALYCLPCRLFSLPQAICQTLMAGQVD